MLRRIHPRRDFQQLEQRRKRAARMFAASKLIHADIARELRVSRQSVSRWYKEWRQGNRALRGAGRAGRKPKLGPQQLWQIERALRQGPLQHGFTTNLWTLPRVALVIEQLTGVRYHPGHVWRILGAIHWTLQRPGKQARERDREKVRLWLMERWPAIKKKLAATGPGSSSKMRAASLSGRRSAEPGRPKGKPRS